MIISTITIIIVSRVMLKTKTNKKTDAVRAIS